MKITLINPNYEESLNQKRNFIPLGIAYIAAILRNNNFNVSIIDAAALDLNDEQLLQQLDNPEIVGITATSNKINAALHTARLVKQYTNALVVLGGVHPTVLPKQTIRNISVDILVIGEGEITFLNLAKAIQNNTPLKRVRGIIFKEKNKIIGTQPQRPIENLDYLPFPAIDLFPYKLYRGYEEITRKKPATHILTTRGCPFNCNFCASKTMWGKTVRIRSPKNIVDEMQHLKNKFGYKEIFLYDDTFNIDLERAEAICDEIINRNLKISWKAQARVYPLTLKLLKKMKKAGCWRVYFGVESGNNEILKQTKKGITLEQVETAFKLCKEAKLQTAAYFMIGNLGETKETIQDTINFAKKIDPDAAIFSITTLFPGTELFKLAIDYGIINEKLETPVYNTISLSKEELIELQKKAVKEFYLRPIYITKKLLKIRSFQELKDTAKAGLSRFIK